MKITGNQMSGIKVKLDTERGVRQELVRHNEDYSGYSKTGNKISCIKVKLDTERSIRQELERQNEDYR